MSPNVQSNACRKRAKLSIVGAGNIGATAGLLAGLKHLGDVYLFDVVPDMATGKALDLSHLAAVEDTDCSYDGSHEYAGLEGSDVVIVTAGVPRKPGMSRDDLLAINSKIVKQVSAGLKQHCPNAFVILITNPLDAMVYLAWRETGFPKSKIVGMAGILDTSRFRSFLAKELNVSVESIHATVLGGHGDAMVPLVRYCTVSGIPLKDMIAMKYITQAKVDEIVERTRNGGGEIVKLLKTGSAFFAPAASAIQMAEAYLHDRRQILPCAAYLNGEYGEKDIFVGVPCIIGGNGVEKVVELQLTDEENKLFKESASSVKTLIEAMKQLGVMNS